MRHLENVNAAMVAQIQWRSNAEKLITIAPRIEVELFIPALF